MWLNKFRWEFIIDIREWFVEVSIFGFGFIWTKGIDYDEDDYDNYGDCCF